MNVLNAFIETSNELHAFSDHPLLQATLDEQTLYLYGLAMVMHADDEIHPSEEEYLRALIRAFELDPDFIDDLIAFGHTPDKNIINLFIRQFKEKSEAQLFMFDALMLTYRDGVKHPKERELTNKMAESLGLKSKFKSLISPMFNQILKGNWQKVAMYYRKRKCDENYFRHILSLQDKDYEKKLKTLF